MSASPRVTVGIPTYDRDAYLAEAIASCLAQDFADFEVLVVDDGSTNPRVAEILAGFSDPRLRVVRHPENRGLAAAKNTVVREARGELIAPALGDDDVCLPDRLRRQVAVFDRHPEAGVVHGDAVIIDGAGRVTGTQPSADFTRHGLVQAFFRRHNFIIDPTTLVHRRVFERVGGFAEDLRMSEDFDLWVRAARHFRFRHTPGGPVVRYRRHGANMSDDSRIGEQVEAVSRALRDAIDEYGLEALVPELDWPVLDRADGETRALEVLADALDARGLPLPGLAAELRARAAARPRRARAPRPDAGRIVLTTYGWNDSGGGTLVPRLIAKELARRGWDVTVFHAAVGRVEGAPPYHVREWEEDGVRLVGVHNRPHGLFDLGNPAREVDDPPITAAFAALLDRVRPDVVHFHNLHNLGAALVDEAAARGIRSLFSAHNHWLICPRAYLQREDGSLCAGPGRRGADCAACVGSRDEAGYVRRLAEVRGRVARSVGVALAPSEAVRRALVNAGYPREMIDVLPQATPAAEGVWERLGRSRRPGRHGGPLRVGFFGSVLPHKGPAVLVDAAQRTDAAVTVELHGEVPPAYAQALLARDARGVVSIGGAYAPGDLPGLLAGVDVAVVPSTVYDAQVLSIAESLAGRVPVVVARMGGMPEGIEDGETGLVAAGRDADDLARALDRLAGEPGLLEEMQDRIGPPPAFSDYVDRLCEYYAGARPARDAAPERPVAVRWVGDHGLKTSLSIVNRETTDRLAGLPGVLVERVERDGTVLDAPLPHLADVEVRHGFPPDLAPAPAGRLAVIQPWEFGSVPRDWAERMRRDADEVWVPSEFVRRMYLDAGLEPDAVHVVSNGVDLERFRPDGPRLPLPAADGGVRFLFVGGLVGRKGPDVLLRAYLEAFAGRDDVTLVVKDFGAGSIYPGPERDAFRAHAESGALPRIVYLDGELSDDDMATLFRACDVLVHPYRGEGFAMPVLEAMAAGLPAIVTAGGPTDEFCPDDACWRIRSERAALPENRVAHLETVGRPWLLEPDPAHLRDLLRDAATDAAGRVARGRAARAAAERLSWDAVADAYRDRAVALAARPPKSAAPSATPFPLDEDADLLVLATPAWRGGDDLGGLLAAWAAAFAAGDRACLVLLADPRRDGSEAEVAERVMAAAGAAGVDLDRAADITLLVHPLAGDDDARLHAAVHAYVPLHAAAAGHERLARRAGSDVVAPDAAALAGLRRHLRPRAA